MTAEADVVKQSDLLNQLVLDRNNMEELGRVDMLWMYPAAHRVLGFICKSGFLGAKKIVFKLPQIQTLGTNSILVHSQPEETDGEKVKQLDSLLNCEVWSDAGNKVGRITDYRFQLKTGEITQYLFVSSGWSGITGDIYQLPPSRIISFGRKRVLVPEAAVKSFELYRPGIKQTLSKARNILKDDYISLVKQAQSLTEHAKERAQAIAEQAKETAQTFTDQLKEETQTFTEQAKTTSQTVAEQVKERTQTVVDQANTGFQSPYPPSQAPTTPEPSVSKPAVSPPPPASTPQPQAATTHAFADEEDDPWDFLEEDEPFTPPPSYPETFRKADTNPKTKTETEDDDDEPWI
ncbi:MULTISPECIES: PRC-barrel domain-containing protein [Trichocoleus]|uniref:PRC-barrel domain-containing protein n=1 Tax=Trichocoleus desertorum GB2-A4 TaxID=2933944 RepID=A0ABV0J5K7_9CYAN|nr:PRC-barrel domain-containing protein [Trichocoleus sp. FACHB-46]MBD1863900.1 PRC-barrel domain-containing protein [Trichocoleus sp. FACHB-46]